MSISSKIPKSLIVDDIEDNRLIIKNALKKEKLEFLEAIQAGAIKSISKPFLTSFLLW